MDMGRGMWIFSGLILAMSRCAGAQSPASEAPAIFVFGDSLVDPGNNNYLGMSLAKANFLSNGIDFQGGQSGRFCNGRTVVDVICDIIGAPYPPPFLDPSTMSSSILHGVNYGSGAGGILDASGANYIERISMNQQIQFFRFSVAQLNVQLGPVEAANVLSKAIVSVVIGSNDFINNYLLRHSLTRTQYQPQDFNVLVLDALSAQLTDLYNLGLRKFVIAALGPIGCIPDQLSLAQQPNCVLPINDQIRDYNAGLKSMLQQLTNNLLGSTFVYSNVYDIVSNIVANPGVHGIRVVNEGCCGAGLYGGQFPCLPETPVCLNRDEYLFWDAYHPSEAANIVLANVIYSGGPDNVSPLNLQQLIALP